MPARILVIEDNPTNLDLMTYLLRACGHTLLSASDGESGLDLARREKPDLVICDVQLPKMDGREVAKQFKCDASLQKIPIIAVTAYAMVGDRDRLLAAGFDGYISKPIDPSIFLQQTQEFLPAERHAAKLELPQEITKDERQGNSQFWATVLVVDDSEVNLNFMRTLLEPFGYQVLTATRPNEALAIARARKPDLIISDVHLAHYSGYDLPKLLRSDPRLASVPCILISSTDTDIRARDNAAAAGAELFILRPIDPEQLLGEINRVAKTNS
jgi:two-component system cell cycle response regulator